MLSTLLLSTKCGCDSQVLGLGFLFHTFGSYVDSGGQASAKSDNLTPTSPRQRFRLVKPEGEGDQCVGSDLPFKARNSLGACQVLRVLCERGLNQVKSNVSAWSYFLRFGCPPIYRKYPGIMHTFSTKILTSKLGVRIICGYICIYVGVLKNTTFVV